MKNFIQDGNVLTLVAPSGGVVSGQPYLVGSIVAVACVTAAETVEFEGALCGVYEFTKVTADAPAQGAKAYLIAGSTEVGVTATGNKLIGTFIQAQINGDTTCVIRLNGVNAP